MPSEKAKMLDGELYDATDPELTADRKRARERTRRYNESTPDDSGRRTEILTDLLGSGGESASIEPPFRCDYGYNVHVGENFYANFNCVVLDVCRVDVGRNCLLGPGAHVYTATHSLDAAERVEGLESGRPVSIGDDVWIGGQAVVNPGVSIGDRSVVASGAVVTRDVPEDVVVQGNPAEVVKELEHD